MTARRLGKLVWLGGVAFCLWLFGSSVVSVIEGSTQALATVFFALAIMLIPFVIMLNEFPEFMQWMYWRSRLLWLKPWTSKPKEYPANINDLVAEDYRRRLFRK